MTFKVGDKVKSRTSGTLAEITYGPFMHAGDQQAYVVSTGGREALWVENLIEAIPDFKVGDKVTHRSFGEGEIAFGPYLTVGNPNSFYQLKVEGGHLRVTAEFMTLVPSDPNMHIHGGVTYDLSAEYADCDGDGWRLKEIDGVVRSAGRWDIVNPNSRTLAALVDTYGPLTKI